VIYSSGYHYFERSPELVHEDMDRQSTGNKRPYIRGEEPLFKFADEHPQWRAAAIRAAERLVEEKSDVVGEIAAVEESLVDPEQESEPAVEDFGTSGVAGEDVSAVGSVTSAAKLVTDDLLGS
jgi:hypothetical protein